MGCGRCDRHLDLQVFGEGEARECRASFHRIQPGPLPFLSPGKLRMGPCLETVITSGEVLLGGGRVGPPPVTSVLLRGVGEILGETRRAGTL